MSNLPSNWVQGPLIQFANINPESLGNKTDPSFEFCYISIESVPALGRINYSNFFKFSDAPSRARRKVKKGDILISTVRPYLKSFAKISSDLTDVVASTGFAVLRARKDVNSDFLFQYVSSEMFVNELCLSMVGSNYPAINNSDVEESLILMPTRNEQKKIAEILTSVDRVIELTEKEIDKLKDLKKGMMQELLTKGIGHTKFKDSPVGWIPEGWEVLTFKELIKRGVIDGIQDGNHGEIHPKSTDFVNTGIPFIMANCINSEQQLNLKKAYRISDKQYESLRIGFSYPGDVLLSHKGTIGQTAIVEEVHGKLMLTPQVTYYRIKDLKVLSRRFLYFLFQSPFFQENLAMLSAQSTRAYIGITAQKELNCIIPDYEEQEKIVSSLDSIDGKLLSEINQIQKMRLLKKGLMQDLLTGKVRVKV